MRVEEDPELWDLAVLEQKIRAECEAQGVPMFGSGDGLPLEVEPCGERIDLVGEKAGSACRPRWGYKDGWHCGHCGQSVLIMRKVPVPLPDVIAADREVADAG